MKNYDFYRTSEASFRFYSYLKDLVSEKFPGGTVDYRFNGDPAVKDAIEAIGIPHTEVDVILANGKSVTFEYRLNESDHIQVFPPGIDFPDKNLNHLSSNPKGPVSFIADVHLGSLARRLRLLGFDTIYQNDIDDHELIDRGILENRVILTKDRGLLKHKRVIKSYLVRNLKLNLQVLEVCKRFELYHQIHLFARCMVCNNSLEFVSKHQIAYRLEPRTKKHFDQFHLCKGCQRVYWKGSHFSQINKWVNDLLRYGNVK